MTKNTKFLIGTMAVVIIICIIVIVRQGGKDSSQAVKDIQANAEVQKMITEINKHIVLPADETPTAAVVSDLSKLQGQPFFERAQLGDVVLVYANTRRVVLWRPSASKIVEVSAINFPSGSNPTAPGTSPKK